MSPIIKPKVLAQVLSSANSDGVLCTMLLNNDGALLAYTGNDPKDGRVVAAIANNIWSSISANMKSLLEKQILESLVIHCQKRVVVIYSVDNYLLCSYSEQPTSIGLLRAKTQAVANYLEGIFRSVPND